MAAGSKKAFLQQMGKSKLEKKTEKKSEARRGQHSRDWAVV